jgi:hypothetical protein
MALCAAIERLTKSAVLPCLLPMMIGGAVRNA